MNGTQNNIPLRCGECGKDIMVNYASASSRSHLHYDVILDKSHAAWPVEEVPNIDPSDDYCKSCMQYQDGCPGNIPNCDGFCMNILLFLNPEPGGVKNE